MKDRKTFKANLENKKGMHFLLGLVLTLTFTIVMIELKQYEGQLMDLGQMTGIEDEDVVPITNRDPAPPPPPPPKPPEVIQIVEDDIEIEEIEFESTETDESEEIEIVEEVGKKVMKF
jgi:protein TonB